MQAVSFCKASFFPCLVDFNENSSNPSYRPYLKTSMERRERVRPPIMPIAYSATQVVKFAIIEVHAVEMPGGVVSGREILAVANRGKVTLIVRTIGLGGNASR